MPTKAIFKGVYSKAFMPQPIVIDLFSGVKGGEKMPPKAIFEGVYSQAIMSGIPISKEIVSKDLMAGDKEMLPGNKAMPMGLVAEPYHPVTATGISEFTKETESRGHSEKTKK